MKYRSTVMSCVLGTAMVVLAATAAPLSTSAAPGAKGHSHAPDGQTAYGKPGNPKKKSRLIEITMKDGDGKMWFEPKAISVKRGEQILFKLSNIGALDHEIVIATLKENLEHAKEMEKNPDMEHDDPNAKRLKPNAQGEIFWHFTKVGKFDMSCLIPGHREAGMTGTITVK